MMTVVVERSVRASSFDRANWPPTVGRVASAAVLLAFAVAAWAMGGVGRVIGGLLVFDVVVQSLPWRHPRSSRSAISIWAEVLLYLAAPTTMAAAAVLLRPPWALRGPDSAWWWIAAVAVGLGLIWLGGIPLRPLLSGDLAFVSGSVSRRHKWARCVSVVAAPPGEELLFRAPLLMAAGPAILPVGLLGAAAFVARHHLPPGLHERTSTRVLCTQIVAAAALLALTAAAHSILPALLAHYLNNAPGFLLELGRPVDNR